MTTSAILTSPYIRLSEVQADVLPDGNSDAFKSMLERLAVDGHLEVYGQHVWIITEFEEQASEWQLITPVGLFGGDWDWSLDLIRFDPNERPDFGVNPRYFRNVSFNRVELFEWLEHQPIAPARPAQRSRGRPPEHDWDKITSIARALASKGFRSKNIFITELIGTIEDQGMNAPGITTLKTHEAIKKIAETAKQNGRKISD